MKFLELKIKSILSLLSSYSDHTVYFINCLFIFWISIRFWETAHLPLAKGNILLFVLAGDEYTGVLKPVFGFMQSTFSRALSSTALAVHAQQGATVEFHIEIN